MQFEIDRSMDPPSCLPTDLDTSNLIDITRFGDSWRKYLDVMTNKVHDGVEYYKLMREMSEKYDKKM